MRDKVKSVDWYKNALADNLMTINECNAELDEIYASDVMEKRVYDEAK